MIPWVWALPISRSDAHTACTAEWTRPLESGVAVFATLQDDLESLFSSLVGEEIGEAVLEIPCSLAEQWTTCVSRVILQSSLSPQTPTSLLWFSSIEGGIGIATAFVPTCYLNLGCNLFWHLFRFFMSSSFNILPSTCHRSFLSPSLGPLFSPFFVFHIFSVSSAICRVAAGLDCLAGWENPPCVCRDTLGALLRGLPQRRDGSWSKHRRPNEESPLHPSRGRS